MIRKSRTLIRISVCVLFAACAFAGEAPKAPAAAPATPTTAPAKPAATAAAAAAAPAGAAAQPMTASDKITLARPTASIELMLEPGKTWKRLVSAEGMAAFGVTADKKKSLDKVGDNVHATVAGDAGTVVVTHAVKDNELRLAFDPDKGNYVCSVRFQLRAQGKGTLLSYSDWYSDEKPATVDQTLKETEKAMTEGLARFKAMVEKATASGE